MYATEVSTDAIVYDAAAYPYFFYDKNANGTVDEGETGFKGWTGRLLKAAYNYQFSIKDPGAYAHNGKLHHRAAVRLDRGPEHQAGDADRPVEGMNRVDAGHFDGSAEAFRHWDAEGDVRGRLRPLPQRRWRAAVHQERRQHRQPRRLRGFQCSTCHDEAAWPALYEVTEVPFPSGTTV